MVTNKPFTTQAPVLVNYTTIEVLNGTGYIDFYGVGLDTASYILTTEQLIAGDNRYSTSPERYPFWSELEASNYIQFYLSPLTIPQTMGGNCIISYGCSRTGSTAPGLQFDFYKNSSLIVSKSVTVCAEDEGKYFNSTVTIPETVFAVGDILSIKVTNDGGTSGFKVYHDPSDTPSPTGETYKPDHTQLRFKIPFKLFI